MDSDRIAVIAERYVALGFKLAGVPDVFISDGIEAVKMLGKLMEGKDYGIIVVEDRIRTHMSGQMLLAAETSVNPLVIFIPSPGSGSPSESVEEMAKRVLGVDIRGVR